MFRPKKKEEQEKSDEASGYIGVNVCAVSGT